MRKVLGLNIENRIFGLDLFRAIAILIVVVGHANYFLIPWFKTKIFDTTLGEFLQIAFTAFDGVDLFFVLSGFLIGGILLKVFNKNENFNINQLKTFWIRRWLRTLPAYYFTLFLNVFVFLWISKTEFPGIRIFSKYLIFFQNLFNGTLVFFPESWSLSVEELFYLSFPFLLMIVHLLSTKIEKKQSILISILFFLLFFTAIRIANAVNCPNVWNSSVWNSSVRTVAVMRLDSIMYGVIFAYMKFYYNDTFIRLKSKLFLAGIIVLAVNFCLGFIIQWNYKTHYLYSIYYSILSLGMACFLPIASEVKKPKYSFLYVFSFVSIISYSLYLINYSIVLNILSYYLAPVSFSLSILCYFLFIIISLGCSVLMYKFIEKPILDYRDKVHNE